jgi:type I restriction enzyme R subunit
MTTGVDCKTCKLIVLDANIGSMTEFKQIIGRGTRLKPEYGKEYFTIMDFRNNSRKFADKDFDGEPVVIYEPKEGEAITPPSPETSEYDANYYIQNGENKEKNSKYRVSDVSVNVLSERVQYYDKDGKLITESLKDYSKKGILEEFSDLDTFLKKWNSEDKKQAIF